MTGDAEWIQWQRAHADALHALQEAQRVYHRSLAGAFAVDGSTAVHAQSEALRVVDLARVRLDEVRIRQPR